MFSHLTQVLISFPETVPNPDMVLNLSQQVFVCLFLFYSKVYSHSFEVFDFNIVTTVQLGYCDSDITVCLLFWNMPIIQDRDVKYPYKQYISYLLAF